MFELDEPKNQKFFDIIEFLNFHYSSNVGRRYKNIMETYDELIKRISNGGYKTEIEKLIKNKNPIYLDFINKLFNIKKIFNKHEIIKNFNTLPLSEQKNVINLAWFILYCKIYGFGNPERPHNNWNRYCKLIEQIKSLPEVSQWIK